MIDLFYYPKSTLGEPRIDIGYLLLDYSGVSDQQSVGLRVSLSKTLNHPCYVLWMGHGINSGDIVLKHAVVRKKKCILTFHSLFVGNDIQVRKQEVADI